MRAGTPEAPPSALPSPLANHRSTGARGCGSRVPRDELRRALRAVRGVGAAILDAVDDRAAALLEAVLEPLDRRLDPADARVDVAPAGRDQVDEQREIVDAGVPLGRAVALEPLQAAEQLVHQPA